MFWALGRSHSRRSEFPIRARSIGLRAALAAVLCATGCAHREATPAATAAAPSATPVPRSIGGPRSVSVPVARAAGISRLPPGTARAAVRSQPATPAPPPQILGASVSPTVVASGTVVHARVRTTAGVVTVTAHAGGIAIPVPRVGPGIFAGATTIPVLPPFVHGSYPVTFVARDARGASTQSAVGVSVR